MGELCERTSFGRQLVSDEIAAGRFLARKLGRRTFILRSEAEEWLASTPRIEPASAKSTALGAVPAEMAVGGDITLRKDRPEETTGGGEATLPPAHGDIRRSHDQ
jgi:hypothetical protein